MSFSKNFYYHGLQNTVVHCTFRILWILVATCRENSDIYGMHRLRSSTFCSLFVTSRIRTSVVIGCVLSMLLCYYVYGVCALGQLYFRLLRSSNRFVTCVCTYKNLQCFYLFRLFSCFFYHMFHFFYYIIELQCMENILYQ